MALMPSLAMQRNGPTKTEMDTGTTHLPQRKVMPATQRLEHPIRTDLDALIPTEMGTPMAMRCGPQLRVQMHSRTNQANGPTKTVMATETMPVAWMRTIVQLHSELQQNSAISDAATWTAMDMLTRTMPSQWIQHNGAIPTEMAMEMRAVERTPMLVRPSLAHRPSTDSDALIAIPMVLQMRTSVVPMDLYGPLPMGQTFCPTMRRNNPIRMEMASATILQAQTVMLVLPNLDHRASTGMGVQTLIMMVSLTQTRPGPFFTERMLSQAILHNRQTPMVMGTATMQVERILMDVQRNLVTQRLIASVVQTQMGMDFQMLMACGMSRKEPMPSDTMRPSHKIKMGTVTETMQAETIQMHVQLSSVIHGRMERLDALIAIKMVGLMSKIHTQTTQHNGRILTETDMVTTLVVRRLMHALERTEIRRLATDMGVLTQMAMDGMMSSMNCQI